MDGCVTLHMHKLWYVDGACLADTTQIVPDEVDDH